LTSDEYVASLKAKAARK
jgi:hypothetical protein